MSRRTGVVFAATLLASFLIAASPARATCGSANCFLITGTQEGVTSRGHLTLDLSYRYVRQDHKLDGRDSTGEVLTPGIDFEARTVEPDHHREISTQNQLMEADLSYGLTARMAVSLALPFFNDRNHEHYDDVGTPEEHFTTGASTSGFGDVRVGLRGALLLRPKNMIVGGVAVKVPTGAYKLLDDEGAIGEPSIMPGTGSTDFIGTLHYTHQWENTDYETFASVAFRFNTGNSLDYQFGNETVLNGGISGRAGASITWSVQLNGRMTGRDEYIGEALDSTGAVLVNLTPGVTFKGTDDVSFYAFVQVPVFQDMNEAQLAPRTGILLGISKVF